MAFLSVVRFSGFSMAHACAMAAGCLISNHLSIAFTQR